MATRSSSPPFNNEQKREYVFKVLVIGELATGKTAVVKTYAHKFFTEQYRATIGVDFALKMIKTDDDKTIRLQLWDIGGQERFGNLTRIYYKDAVGCIVVYDVSRPTTFDAVSKWKSDLDNKIKLPDGSPLPCILIANKCDLIKDSLINKTEQMDLYCKDKGFTKWFETSAKKNINIETAMRYLVDEIMKHAEKLGSSTEEDDVIDLTKDTNPASTSSSFCCGGNK